ALRDLENVVLCPTVPYGFSGHHQFACALSIRPETLLAVLSELLDSLVKAGFSRILVLNGHGGNTEMMNQAIKLAALEQSIIAACCSYWDLISPATGAPGHAGRFETDLMSAAHPELMHPSGTGPSEPPLFDRAVMPGLRIERHGEWQRTGGVTDHPGTGIRTAGRASSPNRSPRFSTASMPFKPQRCPRGPSPTIPPPSKEKRSEDHRPRGQRGEPADEPRVHLIVRDQTR